MAFHAPSKKSVCCAKQSVLPKIKKDFFLLIQCLLLSNKFRMKNGSARSLLICAEGSRAAIFDVRDLSDLCINLTGKNCRLMKMKNIFVRQAGTTAPKNARLLRPCAARVNNECNRLLILTSVSTLQCMHYTKWRPLFCFYNFISPR